MSVTRPGAPTEPLAQRLSELRLRRFRVSVIEGPDAGAAATSASDELSVGTAPGSTLTLNDGTVSRHHCSITASPGGFLLRDLGSRNGTLLGGHAIQAAFLDGSATLVLGRTKVRFEPLRDEIAEPLSADDRYGRALGRSDAMRRIFALLEKVARSEASILLEGETGTGKGLLAAVIHEQSARANGPLVAVDCGAIAPSLIESELFGHVRGAFTGAHADRTGAFEAARGGTLFLDELGELPLDMQPKLLRALEEREVKPVGAVATVKLDVRVIAATNRDLREEVNRGAFRADLYYRLNTVRLRIAPLRERPDDIDLLASHFYEQLAPTTGPVPIELLQALRTQSWPGNVRELRSAVERAVLLGTESLAPPSTRAPQGSAATTVRWALDAGLSFRAAKDQVVAEWESAYLRELMIRSSGNLSKAARTARTDRNYLRELLQRHGLDPKSGGDDGD